MRRQYKNNRPTWKDVVHYDLDGKPACGISEGRIFITWKNDRVQCRECRGKILSKYSEWLKTEITLHDGTKTTAMRVDAGMIKPDQFQEFTCFECGWQDIILGANRKNAKTGDELSLREGYTYHCPKCDEIIWQYYWAVS